MKPPETAEDVRAIVAAIVEGTGGTEEQVLGHLLLALYRNQERLVRAGDDQAVGHLSRTIRLAAEELARVTGTPS